MTKKTKNWEGKTLSQINYYKSMINKRGKETPRWKGVLAGKTAKHKWLNKNFGKSMICENPYCQDRSKIFEWCLKKGKTYSHNRKDYLRLCRSCHRKYDWDDKKREMAIKNLYWFTKKIRVSKYGKKFKENYV